MHFHFLHLFFKLWNSVRKETRIIFTSCSYNVTAVFLHPEGAACFFFLQICIMESSNGEVLSWRWLSLTQALELSQGHTFGSSLPLLNHLSTKRRFMGIAGSTSGTHLIWSPKCFDADIFSGYKASLVAKNNQKTGLRPLQFKTRLSLSIWTKRVTHLIFISIAVCCGHLSEPYKFDQSGPELPSLHPQNQQEKSSVAMRGCGSDHLIQSLPEEEKDYEWGFAPASVPHALEGCEQSSLCKSSPSCSSLNRCSHSHINSRRDLRSSHKK